MKPRPFSVILMFLYVWLMVGFFAGTATLVGPVRWVVTQARETGWTQRSENLAIVTLILLLIIGTALVARKLTHRTFQAKRRPVRVGIPAAATVAAAVSLWAWFNPTLMAGLAPQPVEAAEAPTVMAQGGAEFVFGPYPTAERMAELKAEGYTAVISLLHPAVVPFEPKLLGDEKDAGGRVGLEVIHTPLLPWVGDNAESLNRIREIAASGGGKYYVHCYLGQDRVNLVRRVLEDMGVATAAEGSKAARRLDERTEPFERGPIYELENDIFLIGYPNEHEFFGYLLTGSVKHVVSLLDRTRPEEARLLQQEQALLEQYDVPLTWLEISDEASARAAVERIRSLPRPVAVHALYSEPSRSGRIAQLLHAYEAALPLSQRQPVIDALAGRDPMAARRAAAGGKAVY